jgi:hypothetical protein
MKSLACLFTTLRILSITLLTAQGAYSQGGPIVDVGYPGLRQLADVDGDGRLDYCRFVGDPPEVFLSCQLGLANGLFSLEPHGFNSIKRIDQGYENRPRALIDINSDQRADFCRFVGNFPTVRVLCNLADRSGFAAEQYANPADYLTPGEMRTLAARITELAGGGPSQPALSDCGNGAEKDAALCYPRCLEGFHGVGPICWGTCPAGYSDDGGTCRRDPSISVKKSYWRGVGAVFSCGDGCEYDAGLWYKKCDAGFHGVGPVCWGICPAGYSDDGGTCRRDAHIFAKPSFGRGAGYLTRGDYRGIFYRYIRDHRNIWMPWGNPLREDEKSFLRRYFPDRLIDSVRVVELEGITGAFSHTAAATTYGADFIIIRKGRRSMDLLKHEFVHVCQYDQFGIENFANMYADQYVDNGYDENKGEFEQQAYGFASVRTNISRYLGYCN